MLKKAGVGCAALVVVALITAVVVIYATFWRYQPQIQSTVNSLSPSERTLPRTVVRVFGRIEMDQVDRWIARNLLSELKGPFGGLTRHFNFALWETMIGLSLSPEDRLSLFAHYLPYEGGRGLEGAARFYFGVPPQQLTHDQVLGLLAVWRGPRRFSPHREPEKFREEVERLRRKYGAV
jgi:hypothetical protein